LVGVLAIGMSTNLSAQDLVAEQLYAWEFQRNDINPSDQMPKGWRRRLDRQHPSYVVQHVVPRDPKSAAEIMAGQDSLGQLWNIAKNQRLRGSYNPESVPEPVYRFLDKLVDQCVEIRMDGGSAELISPPVPIERGYTYSLEATVQCEGLGGHQAWVELQILDRDLKTIGTYSTETIEQNTAWRSVHCVSNRDDDNNTRYARVHLKVEKSQSRQLSGIARFDNVRINRLPRLLLTSDLKNHSAQTGKEFTVYCDAIGISEDGEDQRVRFQLLDHKHQVVNEQSIEFTPVKNDRNSPSNAPPKVGTHYVSKDRSPTKIHRYDGRASWKIKIDTPGYYSVRVYLGKQSEKLRDRELPLAIIDALPINSDIPFGWSLPADMSTESLRAIPQLVRAYGAGKIKIPIWLDTVSDAEKIDQIAWLVERLSSQNVGSIGVIDQPPPTQRAQFNDDKDRLPIVAIFQDKSIWEPLLDPILSRMSMKLTWFQLGSDSDHSYISRPDVTKSIKEIKNSLQVYAQDLNVAITWPWIERLPDESLPWDATQFVVEPELSAGEIAGYVKDPQKSNTTQWLSLDLLPADHYTLLDRVRDLTERMIAMKRLAVKQAFVTKPLDPNIGLFTKDLEPLPIAVPWRTLIQNIGASKYIGSNVLPNSSINHFFDDGKTSVMVVWSDKEQTEQLYLGEPIEAVDLWGRPVPIEEVTSAHNQREQKIHVGPWPILVRGINSSIAKFRMQFELGNTSLQSLVGRDQLIPLKVANSFAEAIRGRIDLNAPTLLQNGVTSLPISLGPDRTLDTKLPVQIRSDASAGKHIVRFDFQIDAKQQYNFSTYHELSLGFDDIDLQWSVQKESNKRLMLRLEANNRGTRPTTFDCKLFPSPFPYQSFLADELPIGTTNRDFMVFIPEVRDDAEYWIRCEEIGTRRTLNYRVKVSNK
jgi:hypothetical protein